MKFYVNMVTDNYLKTMGIELLQGRDFTSDFEADKTNSVLVNEEFIKKYNLKDHVNKKVPGKFRNNPEIIGVVKNFNFTSLHEEIQPLVMALSHNPVRADFTAINTQGWPPTLIYITIQIAEGDPRPVVSFLEETWRKLNPLTPVELKFVDATINSFYNSEKRWGKIINYSSFFALVIASLGLFGLSLLTVKKRVKEIGIRKVMGASARRIVFILSKDLLLLILFAGLIALPVAFYTLNKWLQNFAYRINIGFSIMSVSIFIVLSIACITVGFQTIKAARSNPVDTLRYE